MGFSSTIVRTSTIAGVAVLAIFFGLSVLEVSHAGCTATHLGSQTFYQCDDVSGTRQRIGQFDFYQFSDGTSITRQRLGPFEFYNSNREGLIGTRHHIGAFGFLQRDDGSTDLQQEPGPFSIDSFSYGTTCSSQNLGPYTFSGC